MLMTEYSEILQRIRKTVENRDDLGVEKTQVIILDILEDITYKLSSGN